MVRIHSHFYSNVKNEKFNDRWINNGRRQLKSLDLNPLNFCIWDYLKNLVYKKIENENILRKIIINKYEDIKNKSRLMVKI